MDRKMVKVLILSFLSKMGGMRNLQGIGYLGALLSKAEKRGSTLSTDLNSIMRASFKTVFTRAMANYGLHKVYTKDNSGKVISMELGGNNLIQTFKEIK